jgi:hypothetical protein
MVQPWTRRNKKASLELKQREMARINAEQEVKEGRARKRASIAAKRRAADAGAAVQSGRALAPAVASSAAAATAAAGPARGSAGSGPTLDELMGTLATESSSAATRAREPAAAKKKASLLSMASTMLGGGNTGVERALPLFDLDGNVALAAYSDDDDLLPPPTPRPGSPESDEFALHISSDDDLPPPTTEPEAAVRAAGGADSALHSSMRDQLANL